MLNFNIILVNSTLSTGQLAFFGRGNSSSGEEQTLVFFHSKEQSPKKRMFTQHFSTSLNLVSCIHDIPDSLCFESRRHSEKEISLRAQESLAASVLTGSHNAMWRGHEKLQ